MCDVIERIPEALEEDCAQCSEKQRQGAAKVLKHIFEKRPDMFDELEAKYDPEAKYRAKYRERAMEVGVKVWDLDVGWSVVDGVTE